MASNTASHDTMADARSVSATGPLATSCAAPAGASAFPGSRSLAMSLALVPSLLAVGGLHAQTTEAAPGTTPSAADADKEVVELDPLEVQGERESNPLSSPKFTQPLIDVPQTITVIPRDVFEQQGATTLRDVLRNTPGITFQAGEGGTANGDQMTIRGFDARTDIMVDGIRDAGTYTRDAFNLEQVEVAKGPSSALTGRGSTGASVNLVSKAPRLENFRAGTIGVGTDDYRRATVDINENLSDHSTAAGTAVRLNAMAQESGVAGRDEVENKQWAVAPSLAFGLGTPTRVTLSYLHAEQDNIPDYGIPWVSPASTNPAIGEPGGQPDVDQSNWYGLLDRDYEKIQNDVATASFERDLGADTTLRNTSRYAYTERESMITAPRFVSTSGAGQLQVRRSDEKGRDQIDRTIANNTNLTTSFDTGEVTHFVSTGLDVSRETSVNHTLVQTPDSAQPTDAFNPNPHEPFTGSIVRSGQVTDAVAETIGIYLFDTIELTEKWELNGGLRYDHFRAEYLDDRRTVTSGTGAGTIVTDSKTTDDLLSWKAGVVFKPRPNGSIFIGHGTSFNPSAESLTVSTANSALDPEESRSTEIGTKWDLFNRRLNVSAALFRTDKTNARTTDSGGDPVLAGEQRVQGFELGLAGSITENWSVFAGYAYMDSEVRDSGNATELGSALARTPEHSFNVWTTYTLPFGLTLGGGAQYMDEVDRSTTTQNQMVPSFVIWNAMAAYEVNKHLSLRLNVNNLFDEEYVDRVGGGHYIPGPTRSATLTAVFAF